MKGLILFDIAYICLARAQKKGKNIIIPSNVFWIKKNSNSCVYCQVCSHAYFILEGLVSHKLCPIIQSFSAVY